MARGLAGGRTLSVGVLTQTINSPFYGEALRGIEDRLEVAGYIPIFVSGHWHEAEEHKAMEALMSRRVDGLIVLAGRMSNEALRDATRSQVPMVVVGRELHTDRIFSIDFDNHTGGLLATQHLIECGHRRIAFIAGDPLHKDALDREAGYRAALERAGIAFDPALVLKGDFTEAGGLMAVNRLLESGLAFSAIFAANDQTAIGAALGLYRRNVRVPDDVSLVGFDDLAPAKFSVPPLTTIRQSVYEIGSEAAAAMLAMLKGGSPPSTCRRRSWWRASRRGASCAEARAPRGAAGSVSGSIMKALARRTRVPDRRARQMPLRSRPAAAHARVYAVTSARPPVEQC